MIPLHISLIPQLRIIPNHVSRTYIRQQKSFSSNTLLLHSPQYHQTFIIMAPIQKAAWAGQSINTPMYVPHRMLLFNSVAIIRRAQRRPTSATAERTSFELMCLKK